jgi:SAM-dependent methyltransferase
MTSQQHVIWQQQHVVDVRDAAFAARTYLEHRDLRQVLTQALGSRAVTHACEFGAGFGRVTPVLTEYASSVTGFEREAAFVAEAQSLFPHISFSRVASLAHVPAPDASFDLVLTFTVLQHLVDSVLDLVAAEIRRVLRPSGTLVLCEETDVSHRAGDVLDPNGMCTIGRSVTTYAALFQPFTLSASRPRRIEPTYPRPDVGTYMTFRGPNAA